jgi:hypothetical protein
MKESQRGPGSALQLSVRDLLAFTILSLGVRFIVSSLTATIYPDGAIYLEMAADFQNGEFATGLRRIFHPGYPSLISIAHRFGPWTFENTAFLLSAGLGALLTIPIMKSAFLLAQSAQVPAKLSARIAGAILALHSALVLPSSQVLAYPLSHLAIGTALYFTLRAALLSEKRKSALGLAGLATACAYLSRPDGLLIMLGLGFVATAIGLASGQSRSQKLAKGLLLGALFSLPAAVVSGPYIYWVSNESGRLRLTLKKDPAAWLKTRSSAKSETTTFLKLRAAIHEHDRAAEKKAGKSTLRSVVQALKQSQKAAGIHIVAAGCLGFLMLGRGKLWPLVFLFPSLCLLLGHSFLHYHAGYLSRRHCSYQAILFIPVAALGILYLAQRLKGRLQGQRKWPLGIVCLVLVVSVMAPFLPRNFRAHLSHKAIARDLGRWIAQNHGTKEKILILGDEVRTVAYYASADFIDLGDVAKEKDRIARARLSGSIYYVLYLRTRKKEINPAIAAHLSSLGTTLLQKHIVKRRELSYHWWILRLKPLATKPG